MNIQILLVSYISKNKNLSGFIVPHCKKCGSYKIIKHGKYKHHQRYKCKVCGFRFSFVASDIPRGRIHSIIIKFCLDLYIRVGISLKKLAEKMRHLFKIKISPTAIHKWIKKFKLRYIRINRINIGSVWHADETAIKIKGKVYWLWIVLDRKTRTILSWHISKKRTARDAIKVLSKAKKIAGIPELIITDGLYDYIEGIRKVFGGRLRRKIHIRKVGAAFGLNSIIERLNREIKRRIKWFGSFQSLERARIFIEKWIEAYNTQKFT